MNGSDWICIGGDHERGDGYERVGGAYINLANVVSVEFVSRGEDNLRAYVYLPSNEGYLEFEGDDALQLMRLLTSRVQRNPRESRTLQPPKAARELMKDAMPV